jgi:hypothetical protein
MARRKDRPFSPPFSQAAYLADAVDTEKPDGGTTEQTSQGDVIGLNESSGRERESLIRRAGHADEEVTEQIVTLLRQIKVEIANGKSTPQACKEAEITVQTFASFEGSRKK